MLDESQLHMTDDAKELLELARVEAGRLNQPLVRPENILLGAIAQANRGSALAALLLERVGVNLPQLRSAVERYFGSTEKRAYDVGDDYLGQARHEALRWRRPLGVAAFIGPEHFLLAAFATESAALGRAFEELGLNVAATATAIRWTWDKMQYAGNSAQWSSVEPCPAPVGYQTCEACGSISPESVARNGCPICGWSVWVPLDSAIEGKRARLHSMTRRLVQWSRGSLPSPGELLDCLTEAMPYAFGADAVIVWDVSDPASPVPVARRVPPVLGKYVRANMTPATPAHVARNYRSFVESVARDKGNAQIRRDVGVVMLFQKLRLSCDLVIHVAQRSGATPDLVTATQQYLAFAVRLLSSSR